MKEKIKNYIMNEINRNKMDFNNDESLYDNGMLDSLKIIQLVVYLQDAFDITINPSAMHIEDFENIDHIAEFVQQLRGGN